MNTATLYIGIDVSKRFLDVSPFGGKKAARVPNTASGIRALIRRVEAAARAGGQKALLCCEASGGYEDALLRLCHEHGVPIALANPSRVRHHAQSYGVMAKTDVIDASVLASFASDKKPAPRDPPHARVVRLRALLDRRADLIGIRTMEANRLEHAADPDVAKLIRSHLAGIKRHLDRIDALCAGLVDGTPELRALHGRLTAVTGFGPVTAMSLAAYLPELGHVSDKAAASLAGLAPHADESGRRVGRRRIRGGRVAVRQPLYMAALVAVRHNHILRPFYQRLVRQGKPPKLALTAVMRRMVCLANRLLRDPSFQLQAAP